MDDPYADLEPDVANLKNADFGELSSRRAVAKWLVEVVGVGNTFEITELKNFFPHISQIDRRMRDLRPSGWEIVTNSQDSSLGVSELRLAKVGNLAATKRVSNRLRRQVFDRDDNRCVACGIGAGERYSDAPPTPAKLTIGHWVPKAQGGSDDEANLRTECTRCNHAIQSLTGATASKESVRSGIKVLPAKEKANLAGWMTSNQRSQSSSERLFYEWRQLPPSEREELRQWLQQQVI